MNVVGRAVRLIGPRKPGSHLRPASRGKKCTESEPETMGCMRACHSVASGVACTHIGDSALNGLSKSKLHQKRQIKCRRARAARERVFRAGRLLARAPRSCRHAATLAAGRGRYIWCAHGNLKGMFVGMRRANHNNDAIAELGTRDASPSCRGHFSVPRKPACNSTA